MILARQPGKVPQAMQSPVRRLSQCRACCACCADQQLLPQYKAPAEPSAIDQLPAEVQDGFAQVLAALTGSKAGSSSPRPDHLAELSQPCSACKIAMSEADLWH